MCHMYIYIYKYSFLRFHFKHSDLLSVDSKLVQFGPTAVIVARQKGGDGAIKILVFTGKAGQPGDVNTCEIDR